MTTVLVERKYPGDFLLAEQPSHMSREARTALTGNTFKCGQVVGMNNLGKLIPIPAAGDEIHTYVPSAAATAGTYRFNLWHKDGYWVQTADLAYNANTTAIANAINAVLGTSAVAAGGTIFSAGTGGLTLTFSGTDYASLTQPLGWVEVQELTPAITVAVTRTTAAGYLHEVQTLALVGTLSDGTYIITARKADGSMVSTTPLAHDADAAAVLAAMNAALGTSAVAVGGTAPSAFTFTFSGAGYAGIPQPLMTVQTNGITGLTAAGITRTSVHPYGILLEELGTLAADRANTLVLNRNATVNASRLIWGACEPSFGAKALLADRNIDARFEGDSRVVGV